MRRATALLCFVLLLATSLPAAAHRRSGKFRQYVKNTYSFSAVRGSALRAGIQHVRGRPREWGGGLAGYGRRFASSFGHHVVKASIETGVAAWRHENNAYVPSRQKGAWKRTRYAVVNTFVARKPNGRRTLSTSRLAGAMGSGMISRAWHPARYHTVASGVSTGGVSLGFNVGANVAREFLSSQKGPRSSK